MRIIDLYGNRYRRPIITSKDIPMAMLVIYCFGMSNYRSGRLYMGHNDGADEANGREAIIRLEGPGRAAFL